MQQSHTYRIRTSQRTDQKCGKSVPAPSLALKDNQLDEREHRSDNITYTQAGVSCFVGQASGKFKVQFFVGSSVVKTLPAYS